MSEQVNIWALLIVFIIQLVGAADHWKVMKKDGRVSGTLWDYFVADYPGHSVATIVMIAGSSWLAALSGAADFLRPDVLFQLISNGMIDTRIATSITGAVVTAWGVGYAFDSKINKAKADLQING